MATFSSIQRQHVLAAIAEYDVRGGEEFLAVYDFEPVAGYVLTHEGREYDPRALLGVAHRFATGRLATAAEFHGEMSGAVAILRRRGFEVAEPVTSTHAAAPARTTRAARTAGAARSVGRSSAPS